LARRIPGAPAIGDAAGIEDHDLVGELQRELMFCSTSRIDWPSAFSRAMVRPTSATMIGARPFGGLVHQQHARLPISARPIASICCSPPRASPRAGARAP